MTSPLRKKFAIALLAVMAGAAVVSVTAYADGPPEKWEAPSRAARRKNPVASDAKSVAAGKTIYNAQCLSCHGPTGKGDGPQAHDLNPKPRDLSDPAIQGQTDGSMFWKITEGKKPMPTFANLISEDDRWNVINFVRTLAAKGAKQ